MLHEENVKSEEGREEIAAVFKKKKKNKTSKWKRNDFTRILKVNDLATFSPSCFNHFKNEAD